jgi:alkanesulfonate monooxygenase SsuD/methylene tetrahydromethanopterin reductase-like flavin-dependent oxidoreductase (luciferase family)
VSPAAPDPVRFGFVLGLSLPQLFERHVEWAVEAERVGASLLSAGEVSVLTADPYLMLQSFAWHAKTPTVGTVVSMPGLRHPAVHARTMVTLQALTGGRAFLGLGRGLGGLRLLGERSAKMDELVEYTKVVRALCAGEKVVYRGKELQLAYEPRPVPVLIAAWGEKGYDIAGRHGDGMIVGNGATAGRVERARTIAREGAESAGRPWEESEIWYTIRVHPAASEAQGNDEIAFYLTRLMRDEFGTERSLRGLDADLADRIRSYVGEAIFNVDSFDFESKENRELLDRYGLTEWGARQFFLTGTAADIIPRLQELIAAGARNFIVPLALPDIIKTTREVGAVFAELAEVRRSVTAGGA